MIVEKSIPSWSGYKIIYEGRECLVNHYRTKPCPVCGSKKYRCVREEINNITIGYYCFYQSSGEIKHYGGSTVYFHKVQDLKKIINFEKLKIKSIVVNEITSELIYLRNNVYSDLRDLFEKFEGTRLNDRDLDEIRLRGVTDKQIEHMGFFSSPDNNTKIRFEGYQCKVSTAVARILYRKYGDELLKVPGFIKNTDAKGNDYIIFKTVDGYFIPYHTMEGYIVALQYRLTVPKFDNKGKWQRYFWYSSDHACSGSPIDHYIPLNHIRDNIALVTEGATKGKIASEKLGCVAFSMAGVGNANALIKAVQDYEIKGNKKLKIILALDMDKLLNPAIKSAEKYLISEFKALGNSVATTSWNFLNAKGIDDALLMNEEITYKII